MNQEGVFQPFQLDGYECVVYHPKQISLEQLPTVYLQDGKQVLNDLEEVKRRSSTISDCIHRT